jgi:redox-sensitive bicupin YhaK (pirin superfamily)
MVRLAAGTEISYQVTLPGSGVYVFVLEGEITVNGQLAGRRDGVGVTEANEFTISASTAAELLAIEVPMFA